MILIVINVNVNGNNKSNDSVTGDSLGQKRIDLREAIKRVATTVYIGLGIEKAVILIKELLDQ
ncbi:hypothetical protein D3C86_2172760 [compost metagenome]